jgi:ankyrin repeat protein
MGGGRDDDDDDPCPPLLDALFVFQKHRTECEAITTMLLRAGADVRRGTDDGLSPLHIAAMWGLAFIIPALLAAGAEVGAIWNKPQIDDWGNHGDWDLLTPIGATINLMGGHGMRVGRTREFAMLLRAGAIIPRSMDLPPYLDAVAKAGGYERYERAHRARLAAIFLPKFPSLPEEVVHHIVSIWADCGGH